MLQCVCPRPPGNHILNKMGLSMLGSTIKSECYKAPDPAVACQDNYHFRRMLRRFASHVTQGEELTAQELACLKKLGGDCASYLDMKAHHCPSYNQVLSTLTEIVMRSGMPKVSLPGCILQHAFLILLIGRSVIQLRAVIFSNPCLVPPLELGHFFNTRFLDVGHFATYAKTLPRSYPVCLLLPGCTLGVKRLDPLLLLLVWF